MATLIRPYHGSLMARVCFVVIFLQVILLLTLYLMHGFKIWSDYVFAPYLKRRQDRFSKFIEKLVLEATSDVAVFQSQFAAAPKPRWFEKSSLRDILLTYIIEIRGEAKAALFQLYCEYGFFQKDLAQCQSKKWWRRWNAALRLRQMGFEECDQMLRHLINDPYPFIANLTLLHFINSEKNHG